MSDQVICSGIILAGGRSRRMGRDKAGLRLREETLLEQTVRVLRAVAEDVVVVGGDRPGAVADEVPRQGPIGGIATGLRHIHQPYAVAAACDHPFLSARVLRYLADLIRGYDAVVPVDDHIHPLHAVYARSILPLLETRIERGERAMKSALAELRVRWVEVKELRAIDPTGRSLMGVNTPEEWEAAKELVRNMPEEVAQGRIPA
jgi:molybdopterin-guanine dinucleotide biosynthesis protein A